MIGISDMTIFYLNLNRISVDVYYYYTLKAVELDQHSRDLKMMQSLDTQ
jgi:hypothetical protein